MVQITNINRYIGLSTDAKPTGVPQGSTFLETDTGDWYIYYGAAWYAKTLHTELIGNTLQEQLTEADAVADILTFSDDISTVEIYNTDVSSDGTFTVNGIPILVPATEVFKSAIGGTPAVTVTITGSTTYIVSRYL